MKYRSFGSCVFFKKERKIFHVFPIISLWQIITPWVVPLWTPGARLAGLIYIATHKILKLSVLCFRGRRCLKVSHCKSMEAIETRYNIFSISMMLQIKFDRNRSSGLHANARTQHAQTDGRRLEYQHIHVSSPSEAWAQVS